MAGPQVSRSVNNNKRQGALSRAQAQFCPEGHAQSLCYVGNAQHGFGRHVSRLTKLKGRAAVANAKMAYQDYKRLFAGPRWDKLAAKGAKPQRLLWASTGTKNKDYSDVLYVEELIGPNTVNTVPPATLDAFRDHGKTRDSLEENIEDARHVLEELARSGISLDAITTELVKDGVKQFADAADKLYGAVAHKRAASLGALIQPWLRRTPKSLCQ